MNREKTKNNLYQLALILQAPDIVMLDQLPRDPNILGPGSFAAHLST